MTNKLVDDVNETFSNDFINTVCHHKNVKLFCKGENLSILEKTEQTIGDPK